VKVIRKGTGHIQKVAQFDCRKCGSIIEASDAEGRASSNQRDGNARVFLCPVCGDDIWVNAAKFQARASGCPNCGGLGRLPGGPKVGIDAMCMTCNGTGR